MRALLILISLLSFGLGAQEYQPHGIPMGDSYKGYMTCEVIDVVVVELNDGKTTRYSNIEDGFKVGYKMTIEVQYNTSGLVPVFMMEQTEEVGGQKTIKQWLSSEAEFTRYPQAMTLSGGTLLETTLNSRGYVRIDNRMFGIAVFDRYYKDDYDMSFASVEVGEVDELVYFNCPNSGALTTAMDKMFDYVSKMPDNIKSD